MPSGTEPKGPQGPVSSGSEILKNMKILKSAIISILFNFIMLISANIGYAIVLDIKRKDRLMYIYLLA